MQPCPVNWVAIGRADMYYSKASHTFSAEIKRRHCRPMMSFGQVVSLKTSFLGQAKFSMKYFQF